MLIGCTKNVRTGERSVAGLVDDALGDDDVRVICQPMIITRRSWSPAPDIVVLDRRSGIHIIEVKGVSLAQITKVGMDGIAIDYGQPTPALRSPLIQARDYMHDLKNAVERAVDDVRSPFFCWASFPEITWEEWVWRFGENLPGRANYLFADDLRDIRLDQRLREEGERRLNGALCPDAELDAARAAMGEVLPSGFAEPRANWRPNEGTLGETLQADLEQVRRLSPEQEKLLRGDWNKSPRLIRGVAGSGKIAVLAIQVAETLRAKAEQRPVLVVCFNRSMVPNLERQIAQAYRDRYGESLGENRLIVKTTMGLYASLARQGYVEPLPVSHEFKPVQVAGFCLDCLSGDRQSTMRVPPDGLYSAIFVDEGQDLSHDDYRVLIAICAKNIEGKPHLFVFYDDAQNIFGVKSPVWKDIGLEVVGRTARMQICFRNTRNIVEPAYNYLVGGSTKNEKVNRDFAQVRYLKQHGLLEDADGRFHVRFAKNSGSAIIVSTFKTSQQETEYVGKKCKHLIEVEGLPPEAILVLVPRKQDVGLFTKQIGKLLGGGKIRSVRTQQDKASYLLDSGRLTVSTVQSAKGYDAPYVFMCAIDAVLHENARPTIYVGLTRARRWLEITGKDGPILRELKQAVEATERHIAAESVARS